MLKRSIPHALSRVRKALGLTQRELAGLLGCSVIYIKKIEAHAVPMTASFASAVMRVTGADFFQLIEDSEGKPLDMQGGPLTPASLNASAAQPQPPTRQEVDAYVESLSLKLQVMLDAAALAADDRYQNVVPALYASLQKLAGDFQLSDICRQILAGYDLENVEGIGRFARHRKGKRTANARVRDALYSARAGLTESSVKVLPFQPEGVKAPAKSNSPALV